MATFCQLVSLLKYVNKGERIIMAKTRTSIRGVQKKKIIPVKGYVKKDGTRVGGYRRSTPN